jgi:hypothetical protein
LRGSCADRNAQRAQKGDQDLRASPHYNFDSASGPRESASR